MVETTQIKTGNVLSLPKGFKQTEVGLIPVDWEVIELQEVVDFLDGKRKPIKSADRAKMKGQYPYYGASGIIDHVNNYLFDDELILLGEDGENILSRNLQLAFPINGKVWVNNHAHVLKAKEGFNTYFLAEKLESLDYENYNTGTAQPKLNKKTCSVIRFAVPLNLNEQTAIANALSDMDALIQTQEQLIAKKRAVKQGAMQELLKPKEGWEIKPVSEIGRPFGGLSGKGKQDFQDGKSAYIPFLNVMTNSVIDTGYFDYVNIKQGENQNKAQKGDLFFNGSSETPEEVGLCSVLLEDVPNLYLNSFCFGFRFHKGVEDDGLFLSYYFRSNYGREKMYLLAQGATRYNLSKTNFLNLELILPEPIEQTRIANILSDMDREIEQLETQLKKYRQVKTGMMQELLTGKKRLV